MQVRMKNRKQQIVTLALELLQTRGFDSFSYQDLSKRLGITKASIHHHFPKKADLGVALCQAIEDWHNREYAKALAVDGSSLEKLEYYVNVSLKRACTADKICPLSSLLSDITALPDEMRQAIKRLDNQEVEFVRDLLEKGRHNNELSFEGSAHAQALLCVLIYKGALQYGRLHGSELYKEAMQQMSTQLLGYTAAS